MRELLALALIRTILLSCGSTLLLCALLTGLLPSYVPAFGGEWSQALLGACVCLGGLLAWVGLDVRWVRWMEEG